MNSKIFIILHNRFPSEKAASLFAAKTAEAFADVGCEVELVATNRKTIEQDPFEYYNLRRNFRVTLLPVIDFIRFPFFKSLSFRLSYYLFARKTHRYLMQHAKEGDIFYTNETLPILHAPDFMQVVYELHDYPESKKSFYQNVYDKCDKILVTNTWKTKRLSEEYDGVEQKVFTELNAVDAKEFQIDLSKTDARKQLGLSVDQKIILYTGHLYGWKGVDTLAETAQQLPPSTVVYFVGGTNEDIAVFTKRYTEQVNIKIIGHRLHQEIPVWQKAADVLVLPNTARQDISKYYTSPMKLFEYMLSGRPVVASDIPSIREVAQDSICYFEADSPKSLANTITKVLASPPDTKAAEALVLRHTWRKRAERIILNIRFEY